MHIECGSSCESGLNLRSSYSLESEKYLQRGMLLVYLQNVGAKKLVSCYMRKPVPCMMISEWSTIPSTLTHGHCIASTSRVPLRVNNGEFTVGTV